MIRISAVIPTRGDVPMGPIMDHLREYPEIEEIIIVKGDTPYNRYGAAARAKNEVIYTQDDDCLTDIRPLIDGYDPAVIVNSMTPEHAAQYPGRQTLIGFGAIFNRSLSLKTFASRDYARFERDELFYRESDRIFATVNPHKTVFPQIEILPCAHNPNRLWKQPDHVSARIAMEQRIFEVTGIRA